MTRRTVPLAAAMLVAASVVASVPATGAWDERTEWVMGTTLRIVLPADLPDRDAIFDACFVEARRWDGLLSPWRGDAPLSRLSAAPGHWVTLPADVLAYLDRATRDAERTNHVFDITLVQRGSRGIEIDRRRSRARLPIGFPPLDPGGDGKGVALDAMATILDTVGVREALMDFGGSSYLARGGGPEGAGWQVALSGADGAWLGVLTLIDTALSVSCTVQRDRREDGTVVERHHLRDLRTSKSVRARRTAAVLSGSATEAEVLSTAVAIVGAADLHLLDRFPGCAVGIFTAGESATIQRGGFADCFRARITGTGP